MAERPGPQPLSLTVNGEAVTVHALPHESLASVLREHLRLTGLKVSCDVQVCGACTVLVDDLPVSACTYLAYEARGKRVLTVEGLSKGDDLHPLQRAFIEDNAFQCGFCTSGMLLAAHAYLSDQERDDPGNEDLLEHLAGNLCRCTGYVSIVAAVLRAQQQMGGAEPNTTGAA